MNRRNLLIGIGTAAAGSGAVLGSGALTQVTADRSVTIGVNEDSNALLGLSPAEDGVSEVTTTNGEITFNLPENLNDQATTTFGAVNGTSVDTAAFIIENNTPSAQSSSSESEQTLSVSATVEDSSGSQAANADILKLNTVGTVSGSDEIVDITGGNSVDITSGGSKRVAIEVDTTDGQYAGTLDIQRIEFTAE